MYVAVCNVCNSIVKVAGELLIALSMRATDEENPKLSEMVLLPMKILEIDEAKLRDWEVGRNNNAILWLKLDNANV